MNVRIVTGMIVLIAVLLAAASVGWLFRKFLWSRRRKSDIFEDMEGHEFEYFCADLLEQRGFTEVEVTRGSGDYGIDILAEKEGVTYAIQCKCHAAAVGVRAIQEAYAGRDYYDRMVGAVMTNQYFTAPAVEAAGKLKILLWDGGYVGRMMEEADCQ